ncbi:bifunctional copper resistance protein CopD/cytochrome c oxidase assembly protein [Nocardia farcinica]|uniref:cytochrome c oxidase assembly protein n=1 Tax=Nocardia farcinica TaxID=37329 RepID=UPI001895CF3E|nr:cytochrome c oxidase assembly protein [Nocardia farcinica]MBF6257573.1 bifunctional copper resistance protein CopD/cytochrome c oxidase assembly protein [Nocardia farcinica]MBF6292018.1 bifunctional copper resistance protein CopD/cytochrome c oxidase assembly protein [Nocardia farcinica]MBF6378679.1 bifunctional copper resistance protein CopD/cytochrome c oxidase assembly protein [Nocardia farcinica]MBF6418460.1 bifunctional copper resistance protein CopD/cytochrome c oxidase assembly protei
MSSPQDPAPATAAPEGARSASAGPFAAVTVVAGAIAAVVAALVVGLSAAQALSLLGIPDPGALTTYGLPAVRALADLFAALTVGALLCAAFLVPPQANGVLDVGGYRAVRMGSNFALAWAVCAALLVPLTVSDTTGQPVADIWRPEQLWRAIGQVDIAEAWRTTVVFALIVAVGARLALRWGWTPVLFGGSILTMMPLALTGHSASGGSHDVATNSLILHLVAAAVWVGGLFAVLAHALRGGAHTDVATRRFSAIATVAFVVIGVSGVINSWVRVPLDELVTTTYGRLVLAKAAALAILGVIGYLQRRSALPALAADPRDRGALIRFAGVEALVFAATMGLAVGLGRTPPPPPVSVPTPAEVELGYDLAGPPTVARMLFDWRFDLIFGTLAIVLAVLYLLGVRRLHARGDSWPVGRTIAWLCACALLLVTTSSGIGRYAPAMFSVHMMQHMALSMLAPILFALGGVVTLALRALRPAGRGGVPGPREWILAAVHNPVSRFLTHPIVASVIFVAGFYALYMGGIYDTFVDSHGAHLLMNLHFLLSGYLFYWVVIGIDPKPRQVEPLTKLGMVFGSLPFHAFFGVALMSMTTVMGGWFFRSLDLGWNGDLLGDQRTGGSLAWASGEVPLVVVMLALLIQWSRSDERMAKRYDRAAERDHDAELAAHNAMFAELARRDGGEREARS